MGVGNSFDMDDMMPDYLDLGLKISGFDEEKDQLSDAAKLRMESRNEEEKRNGIDEEKDRANLQKEISELKEEIRELKEEVQELKEDENRKKEDENTKLREGLKQVQKMVIELKKNEKKNEKDDENEGEHQNEIGYEFPNDKYFRIRNVLRKNYISVWDVVVDLLLCFVTLNRGKEYKERTSEGGRSEEGEKASKKRKRGGDSCGIDG